MGGIKKTVALKVLFLRMVSKLCWGKMVFVIQLVI